MRIPFGPTVLLNHDAIESFAVTSMSVITTSVVVVARVVDERGDQRFPFFFLYRQSIIVRTRKLFVFFVWIPYRSSCYV